MTSGIAWIPATAEIINALAESGPRFPETQIHTAPANSLQMKPDPQKTEKNLSDDQKTFEELPTETQELLLLGDEAEKTSGRVRAKVENKLKQQSGPEKQ